MLIPGLLPPWVALAGLVGVFHGALFHLVFGARPGLLPRALGLALAGSLAGAGIGAFIPPAALAVGDTNLIAASGCAWAVLGMARLFRFC